nr:polyprotein [Passiflora foetida virus Y]
MASIMIGSVVVPMTGMKSAPAEGAKTVCCKHVEVLSVQKDMMATSVPSVKEIFGKIHRYSKRLVSDYDQQVKGAFDSFFKTEEMKKRLFIAEHSPLQQKKNGLLCIRRLSLQQAECRRKQLEECEEKHADFLAGRYEPGVYVGKAVLPIYNGHGHSVGFRGPYYRRTVKQHKRSVVMKPLEVGLNEVLDKLLPMARDKGMPIEIIGKRKKQVTLRYVQRGHGMLPKITLPHEHGQYLAEELNICGITDLVEAVARFGTYQDMKAEDIRAGDSGLMFSSHAHITQTHTKLSLFVVRGRLDGVLVNALEPNEEYWRIRHYSQDPEKQFFAGWRKMFNEMVPQANTHECTVDYNNEECGAFAALMTQSIFPVKKLSCKQCRSHIENMSWDEYKQFLVTHMGCHNLIWHEQEKVMGCKVIEKFVKQATSENTNLELAMEIARLTQNYTSTQMLQIQDINRALIKGSSVTQQDLDQALKQLLAMTQWWKNHMSLTGEEALKTFRNKRSAKALLNPSLLCDNQLDKNGNFIWGERGKHSKRFFANFFEEIDPTGGYEKYKVRNNPNGRRELAIGSLIVPLDFERARSALQGKSINREPLTAACTSKQGGNFIYPCCCVTQDDGRPLYSELKTPTKRHLVVGATGEPKYIDLPATDSERMYIAKEGYCYLNIFLAMLVNVNEDEAKNFTKKTRDALIPRLGKWPTVMDVATAMYILTVLHPETRNAELPRILVDHATQTMHVIDSFGSLNTGYHVLKAGTVNQFIQFASDDLTGEMKHYRVGGTPSRKIESEDTLIKGIFKPKQMVRLLQEDPYIVLMGLVSPTILVHMYRMRHFEKGIELWINKEQNVAKIFIILEQLTRKISVNKILLEQISAISEASGHLCEILQNCPGDNRSYVPAMSTVTFYMEQSVTNRQLELNGYYDINAQLYTEREKIFAQRLKKEWHDLSWLEKSCVTWQLKRFSPATETALTKRAVEEKSEFSRYFVSECYMQASTYIRTTRESLHRRCIDLWSSLVRKIVNTLLGIVHKCYSDIIYLVNLCLIFSLLVQMSATIRNVITTAQKEKAIVQRIKRKGDEETILHMYDMFCKSSTELPKFEEFVEHVQAVRPDLTPVVQYMSGKSDDVVAQGKTAIQSQLEKIVAIMALITLVIDGERSDAIFKTLSKLKTVFSTMGEDVRVQSLDEINNLEDDKKLTVDFELETSKESTAMSFDVKFEDWWNKQLQQNRVVPHYRSTGEFLEFTRETSAKIANQISLSSSTDFLVRGAVGSGKSTGLPHHLAKKGKVLLLEPTRPLAENVSKQLGKDPFYHTVTLRMRGLSRFGSSNITVMTSGFAFHYYVNNPTQLAEFDFIIIDECHAVDCSTIAFNCALKEYEYSGKLIKVSATPPGRECEFTTQHAVKLKVEDQLSFANFVNAQGTGSNADMVQHGHNILVYVASYNEVDTLAKLLNEKHYKVTKVDGRTMQMGNVEIETCGTEAKPHFVVATNIIENGVTIDIDCVVDFGTKVVAALDSESRCVRYQKKSVTYGERIQRLGRVGRCKPGYALRVGHTEKGLEEVPEYTATEAAFLSFAYGLPVTTQSVTTNLLSKCTVKQARSALNFELTPFFTVNFIKYDGSMHPEIHKLLKGYKLRESEMILNKLAIPYQYTSQWLTCKEYDRQGIRVQCPETTRIPFYVNGIPDKLFEMLWDTVCKYKCDAGFGRIKSVNATKISYTLSTDLSAIPRTIAILDHLIAEEMMKKAHFDTIGSAVTGYSFSLAGIADGFRKRYLKDYTQSNIAILQQARAQLLEFDCTRVDLNNLHNLEGIGVLNTVQLQSKQEIVKFLGLRGKWDGKKFMNDIIVAIFVLLGGGWMMWEFLVGKMKEPVATEGKKRQVQKLKFRDAYDRKIGREVYADDYTMEHTFGEAYTKKGKAKGSVKTKGMGKKNRNFYHFYGFDPTEYTTIRFVDPLTGHTLDEGTRVDIRLVQDEIGEIRSRLVEDGELEKEAIRSRPGIQAYFFGKGAQQALKVDLNPHIPTVLQRNCNAIAGFPEREDELRQTGAAQVIPLSEIPKSNEMVEVESKSTFRGLRDYNHIATLVCQLTNTSDGHKESIFGIGYGPYVITNGHLFRRNNGTLTIKTWHGEFIINNTTQIKMHFIEGKDMILIRMPKDFPPFIRRNCFRGPKKEERVCMIGTNFQDKSLRSTMSESSIIVPEGTGSFWTHWISTQEGDCGIPMVSTTDGFIVGIHGLSSQSSQKNFFVPFIDEFVGKYLEQAESLKWDKHWLWQPDRIAWGSLTLIDEQPKEDFNIAKLVSDLFTDGVEVQSKRERWVFESVEGNLRAVGQMESALVTKHVVKGKCRYFEEYLCNNKEANEYFRPLMGAYQPSKLNRDAFKKDFFKYNKPIVLNEVVFEAFCTAIDYVKMMMIEFGFHECNYVTDPDEIFDSLNMKAAVGAQYKGKKKDYFAELDTFDRERLLFKSSERLFYGEKGVWNGSLKAELRPLEKVQANKTRTFTAAPIDTLLGAKVCVDDFNNQFYSLNLICPWTVGMTKFYGGWDQLMRSLPDGWVYCHADGSQFDSSLTPLLLNAVLDIRSFFMEDWWVGSTMLENLYAEIVYTPILAPDGTVFKKFRGNNSGQPSTVVDNTLMVVIAVYYSCVKQKWDDRDIQERLVFFANGDDIILAVREEDVWLYDVLGSSFSELGLNYNFDERTRRREDLWFMSHQAIEVDGLYIPKLERERIVSILEWDRSKELTHRTEAICAAMIEAWAHTDLLQEIRKFYLWLLQKDEFKELSALGKTPYIAETALRKLYTDRNALQEELQIYADLLESSDDEEISEKVVLQSSGKKDETIDAGNDKQAKNNSQKNTGQEGTSGTKDKEKDINAGTHGMVVPRLQKITKNMKLPTVKGNVILDIGHLLDYKPAQTDLFNTRATKAQFEMWYEAIKREYELEDHQMAVVMNGFMVWCIDNGTSPDINGVWVMMDGDEQIEYPLKPMVENAKPTLRQIMHHFSDAAEAYIEMRNSEAPYMPRYGLLRNLRDRSLARYAFDFYEVNSKTSERAREAVAQMKAAALSNVNTRLFGLDGNVATTTEDTERHTARDVSRNMHSLLGMNSMQ